MGNRVMRSHLIAKECERHEVNREIFTWKKLWCSPFFDKVAGLQFLTEVFSCEHCEIFKSNYFEEHLQATVYVSY